MKLFITLLFSIVFCFTYGQRVERFSDSLTNNNSRTWIDIDGSPFTELGSNCNYGMEVTFFKQDNKVIFHQCHEGEWKPFEYTFRVRSIDGEHFVELYENNTKNDDYEFEAQMVAKDGENFITELTLFYFNDKTIYTLRSKN